MRTIHTVIISLILTVLGLAVFAYKVYFLGFPIQPDAESKSWYIEAKIALNGHKGPVKVTLLIPQNTHRYIIMDENFISQGYGLSTQINEETGNRVASWSRRHNTGQQTLLYRALISKTVPGMSDSLYKSSNDPAREDEVNHSFETMLSPEQHHFDDTIVLAITSLVNEVREHSVDTSSFVGELYKALKDKSDDRTKIIKKSQQEGTSRAELASLVLNAADIPAHIVNGLLLESQKRRATFTQWLEVYSKEHGWIRFDMKTGKPNLFGEYLPWYVGKGDIVTVGGNSKAKLRISVKQNTEMTLNQAIWNMQAKYNMLSSFTLFNLPIDNQLLFRVLLLVPIGGLVLAFLRQVVGIKTFGTFMPVLVALSFLETQLAWGITFFIVIVAVGLIIRAYLDALQLLMVPRLAAVLTIVVLLIALLSGVTYQMGINAGLSLSLFPMVIITMTIERMSIMWEEYGAGQAMVTGLGSLLAAIIAYGCISNKFIGHLVFVFPELLLVVLALTLLLGRYNGYKLAEYKRFKSFAQHSR